MLKPEKNLIPTNLFCAQAHTTTKLKATTTTTHKKEHFTTKDVFFYKYQTSSNLQAAAIQNIMVSLPTQCTLSGFLYYCGCGLQIFVP